MEEPNIPNTEDVFIGGTKEEFNDAPAVQQRTVEDIAPSEDVMLGFEEKNDKPKPKEEKKTDDKKSDETTTSDAEADDDKDKSSKSDKKKETDSAQKDKGGKSADQSKEKSKGEKSEGLKVSFNSEQETESKSKDITPDDTKETEGQLTEHEVLQFLQQDERFRNLNTLEDLKPQEELPEAVAKFKEFHETTGRGIEAYHLATKDWSSEDKDEVIRQHLALTNPRASEANIDKKLNLLKLTDDERDVMSDREIARAELEYDEAYGTALNYMQDFSKKFAAPKETVQATPKVETPESQEKMYGNYWKKRDASLKSIEKVDIDVDGLGQISIPISEEDKKLVAENTNTFKSFFNRWQDKKSGTLNTDALSMDNLWGIKPIREKLITKMLEQMHALTVENLSKSQRKVTIDKPKSAPEIRREDIVEAGLIVDGETEADRRGRKVGQPLF